MKRLGLFALFIGCLSSAVMASARIERVEFKDAEVRDAARILATMTGVNVAVTAEAGRKRVDLLLQDTRLKDAIDMLTRVSGLWYRYNKLGNSYIIMTEKQYQEDIVVYRDDIIKTFTLRHQNVNSAALTIQNLFGERVRLSLQTENDDFDGLPFDSVDEVTVVSRKGQNNDQDYGVAKVRNTESDHVQLGLDDPKNDLTAGEIRELGKAEKINVEQASRALGSKTPIFVATNRMHNLLFVRTSDENALAEIEKLIKENDRPTPQVLLEMKIVRISVGEQYNQDFDLSFNDALNLSSSPEISGSSTVADFNPANATLNLGSGSSGSESDSSSDDSDSATDLNTLMLQLSQLRGQSVSGLGFNSVRGGFYEFFSNYVNARLELLQKNNQAEVVAKPVVLASNNRSAKLFLGEEQVIATGISSSTLFSSANENGDRSSLTTQTLETERRKVGNTLVLKPSINADRTVTIDILQDSSTINRGGLSFPMFDNKTGSIKTFYLDSVEEANVKTVVVAKDGNTIALGGMISEEKGESHSTVPVLGDIPYLGELFSSRSETDENAQYIMLLTPHILLSPDEAAEKSRAVSDLDFDRHSGQHKPVTQLELSSAVPLLQFARQLSSEQAPSLPNGVLPVAVARQSVKGLLTSEDVELKAVDAWQHRGTYLTRIEVSNSTESPVALSERQIAGDWLAASLSEPLLGQKGQESSRSWLYLLSGRPFDQVISELE